MRTRICWMLGSVATIVMTTALLAVAQELPSDETLELARQQQRNHADALTAVNASAFQAQQDLGTAATAPAANRFNNQNRMFHSNGVTTIYGSPYPGFNSVLARVNNEANKQIVELVKKIKDAESEEVKLELKAEVKLRLEEQYDAYLTHHEEPLNQLEERLKKLRAEFESRKKAKDDLVKLRLDTIWYDAIGLGWPDDRSLNRIQGATWPIPHNRGLLARPDQLLTPTASDPAQAPRLDPKEPLAKPPEPNFAR